MVNLLGMPFEVALAVILINGLLYLTHHLLGAPVLPGWITPAIPLVMAYCETFPEGEERIHALISFQILPGIFSMALGITGLAKRVITAIPAATKAGALMGAGIAAVQRIFGAGGEFHDFPITITIVMCLAFFLMYSRGFASWRARNRSAMQIGKLGVLPCIIVAVVVTAAGRRIRTVAGRMGDHPA